MGEHHKRIGTLKNVIGMLWDAVPSPQTSRSEGTQSQSEGALK